MTPWPSHQGVGRGVDRPPQSAIWQPLTSHATQGSGRGHGTVCTENSSTPAWHSSGTSCAVTARWAGGAFQNPHLFGQKAKASVQCFGGTAEESIFMARALDSVWYTCLRTYALSPSPPQPTLTLPKRISLCHHSLPATGLNSSEIQLITLRSTELQ